MSSELIPTCRLHRHPLRYVERTPPGKGLIAPAFPPPPSEDAFLDVAFERFPHARPMDPWVTSYFFCPTCDSVRLEWKERQKAKKKLPG